MHNRWVEKQTYFVFLNFFLKLFSFFFFHFFVCRQSFGPNISLYTCYNWCMQYVQHWTRLSDSWPLLKYVGSIASATQSVFLFVNVANLSQFVFFFCQFYLMEILLAVFFLILQKVECLPEISKFYFVRLAISYKNNLIWVHRIAASPSAYLNWAVFMYVKTISISIFLHVFQADS